MKNSNEFGSLKHVLTTTALCSVLAGSGAVAQSVTLTTEEGNATVVGDLLSFENGVYTIETVIGEISIGGDNVVCEGPGCPGAEPEVAAAEPEEETATGTIGAPVSLTTRGGGVRVDGTLVAIRDGFYTVETVIGTFDVMIEGTTCDGPGCPVDATTVAAVPAPTPDPAPAEETAVETAVETAEPVEPAPVLPQIGVAADGPLIPFADVTDESVRIAGPASVLDGLLPELASGFASANGGTVSMLDSPLITRDAAASAGYPSGRLGASVMGADGSETGIVAQLTSTSSDAIGQLNAESADIALTSTRAPMMLVQNRTETVLGTEALVAVVAPTNSVVQLSPAQLAGIFAGEITNWNEVGGGNREIEIYALPDTHDLTVAMNDYIMKPQNKSAREPDAIFPDEASLSAAILNVSSAIGFVSIGAKGEAKDLAAGSRCGIVTPATPENIRTARYPYSRSLLAISFAADGPAGELVRQFDSLSDEAVVAAGLQPVSIDRFTLETDIADLRARLSDTTERFARLNVSDALRIMPVAERLGSMLTMDGSTNRLDTRSKADLDRIIDYASDNDLTEIFIVGHADNSGNAQADRTRARTLARVVRQAIVATDSENRLEGTTIRAVGLGAVAPIACGTDEEAVTLNRRVEIWVRR